MSEAKSKRSPLSAVIPGRALARPESMAANRCQYGFRACAERRIPE